MAWYDSTLDLRAAKGGEESPLNCKGYRAGEFMPFDVPRIDMPQIDATDMPGLFAFLKAQGVVVTRLCNMPVTAFHPRQKIIMDKAQRAGIDLSLPILAANDGTMLDGNHRWDAHKLAGTPLDAFQIGLPFEQAIKALFSYPKTYIAQHIAKGE